jgi:hypothetical protein
VHIGILDNPGWQVRINIEDTAVAGQSYERTRVDRDEHDWLQTWVEDGTFHAACGPHGPRGRSMVSAAKAAIQFTKR